jgi:hypothetical protein
MPFRKGDAKPPGSGRGKGSRNKTTFDVREALKQHGSELAKELLRIALHAKNDAIRVSALKECLDRILGKASQPIEGQMLFGVSAELQRLLERHDGSSRSIPERNGALIEHEDIADVSEAE